MPPIALYLLTAVLREYQHEVMPIDPITIREYLNKSGEDSFKYFIAKFIENADVICFSSNTLNWAMTKSAIFDVRSLTDKPIIVGGIHPTYFSDYIIQSTPLNFILKGEGEFTLPKLLDAIKSNSGYESIPGLVFKNKFGKIIKNKINKSLQMEDFYNVPIPAYDYMPANVYTSLPIESSRGCKYSCRFCSIPRKHDWACFDTDWAIERICTTIDRFGSKFCSPEVYITDDCFTAEPDRAAKILENLIKHKSNIAILLEARVNDIRKKNNMLLEQLSRRQVCRVATGVECGYNEGLKMIKKGLTIEQLEDFHIIVESHGIMRKTYYTFIFGFPWETMDDCLKTIDYAASIEERFGPHRVNINWLIPMPSQLWEERPTFGNTLDEEVFDDPEFFNSKESFYKAHPNINPSIVSYIDKHIKKYEDAGIMLRNH